MGVRHCQVKRREILRWGVDRGGVKERDEGRGRQRDSEGVGERGRKLGK